MAGLTSYSLAFCRSKLDDCGSACYDHSAPSSGDAFLFSNDNRNGIGLRAVLTRVGFLCTKSMNDEIPLWLVRLPELKRITGLSARTLDRLERRGLFPRRWRIGAHAVAWQLEQVPVWVRTGAVSDAS